MPAGHQGPRRLDTGEAAREHHVVDQQPGNSVVPLDEFVDEVEDLVFRLLDAVDVVLRKQGHDHPGVESRRLVDDAHRHGVAGVSLSQVRIGRQGPIGQRVEVETRKVRSVEKGENLIVATLVDVCFGRLQTTSRHEGVKVVQEGAHRRQTAKNRTARQLARQVFQRSFIT